MKTKRLIASILCLSLIFNGFTVAFTDDFNEPKKASISNAVFTEASPSEIDSDEEGFASTFEEVLEAKDENDEATNTATVSEASDSNDSINIDEEEAEEDLVANDSALTLDEDIIASDSEITSVDNEMVSTESELTQILMEEDEISPLLATDSEINLVLASGSEIILNEDIFSNTNNITATNSNIITIASESNIATDSSIDEDENRRSGFIPANFTAPKAIKNYDNMLFGATNLPSQYDARTIQNNYGLSIVPPVRDQGNYGTCWAHSTIGMIETSIRTKNLVSNEEESNLSEAALAYFIFNLQDITKANSSNIDKPGIEGNDYTAINKSYYDVHDPGSDNFANAGGNQFEATLVASTYMGIVTENDDTLYSNGNVARILNQGLDGKYAFNSNSFEIKNVEFLNKDDIDLIKSAIMRNGSVGINYCEKRTTTNCSLHDGEYYYLASRRNRSNHAVMIVGWNDDVPKEYFRNAEYASTTGIETVNNNGAWLIRNSWGPSNTRMNAGYFWMSYEDPSIDDSCYSIEAIKKDTYKYNYHYDTTSNPASIYVNNSSIGNIYQVSNDEDQILEAMNVALADSDIDFNIEVYVKDTKMNNPTDGTKISTKRYTNNISGIWTVELNTKRVLKKGSYFSIILKLNRPCSILMDVIDNENRTDINDPRAYYNMSEYGQSFVSLKDLFIISSILLKLSQNELYNFFTSFEILLDLSFIVFFIFFRIFIGVFINFSIEI